MALDKFRCAAKIASFVRRETYQKIRVKYCEPFPLIAVVIKSNLF